MKHNFLTHKEDIIDWLDANNISFYTVFNNPHYQGLADNDNCPYLIDTKKDVYLSHQVLGHIPVQFNIVGGSFFVSSNRLTSLKGSPHYVEHNYECKNNFLTSLEHCPTFVGKSFDCRKNKLINLKGAPKIIKGNFACNINALKNLKYCPEEIGGEFVFSRNEIESLDFFPKKVGGNIVAFSNKMPILSKLNKFEDLWVLHERHQISSCIAEQNKLLPTLQKI